MKRFYVEQAEDFRSALEKSSGSLLSILQGILDRKITGITAEELEDAVDDQKNHMKACVEYAKKTTKKVIKAEEDRFAFACVAYKEYQVNMFARCEYVFM